MKVHSNQALPTPIRTVDMRHPPEREDSCVWACNLNFSRVPIQARYAFESVPGIGGAAETEENFLACMRTVQMGGSTYLVAIRNCLDAVPTLVIFDARGVAIGVSPGMMMRREVGMRRGKMAIAVYRDRIYTSPANDSYLVEINPSSASGFVAAVVMENGYNIANRVYAEHAPPGRWMCVHQNRMWWGGFDRDATLTFKAAVPTYPEGAENWVPDRLLNVGRITMSLSSQMVVFSDAYNVKAVGSNFFVSVEDDWPVTGGISWRGRLLVFTQRSVWEILGNTVSTMRPQRLASNAGCVSHETIVDCGDSVIFLAEDGFYQFDGSQSRKISEPVDPIFGRGTMPMTHPIDDTTLAVEPPRMVDSYALDTAHAGHYAAEHQYWCALPTAGAGDGFALGNRRGVTDTIWVYDYVTGSQWFYRPSPVTSRRSYCDAIASGPAGGGALYLALNGRIYRYGPCRDRRDRHHSTAAGSTTTIPVSFVSRRYGTEDQARKELSRIRVVLEGTGKLDATAARRIKWWACERGVVCDGLQAATRQGEIAPFAFPSNIHSFYGDATWLWGEAGTFYQPEDAFVADLAVGLQGQSFQFGLSEQRPDGSLLKLYGLGIDYAREAK